jgi:hypothetical protein
VPGIGDDELHGSWHLIEPDGTRRSGDEAALPLLEHLAVTRPVGSALRRAGLGRVPGAAYRVIRANRGRLGRLVPDVEATRRPP